MRMDRSACRAIDSRPSTRWSGVRYRASQCPELRGFEYPARVAVDDDRMDREAVGIAAALMMVAPSPSTGRPRGPREAGMRKVGGIARPCRLH